MRESIADALNNRILVALAISGVLVLISTWVESGFYLALVQFLAILFGIFAIVSIGSVNDYFKDKQFVILQSFVKDELMPVIRGKYGATQSINIYDLVVGDIVLLETGCRVPADCILIQDNDMLLDESFYE